MELPQLLPPQPNCTLCELHDVGTHCGVPWRHLPASLSPTSGAPTLLVVGMNPGFHEDESNECWVGKSGQLLTGPYLSGSHLLAHASIYLGNLARCLSPAKTAPSPHQYRTCFKAYGYADLLSIFAGGGPAYVLAAGAHPIEILTSLAGHKLKQQQAFASQGIEVSIPGLPTFKLFSTYHPAKCLRDPTHIRPVSDHLALLLSTIRGEAPTPTVPWIVPPAITRAPLSQKPLPCSSSSSTTSSLRLLPSAPSRSSSAPSSTPRSTPSKKRKDPSDTQEPPCTTPTSTPTSPRKRSQPSRSSRRSSSSQSPSLFPEPTDPQATP